ncbi:hypothetical protein DFW101_0538 [Solidesulfovibrio carbinoliphilus subsp. oakridgensis]|uniref:Uncharacterized protein n=1 Tax=Solidesulfovibrio carbinoliphilus subsp. oakridgensis TaxID=694327 RepID=G7QDP9_9BACT|nr:hypothetical protein [Solidesulfovibrio carbinoliphilus]EHJ46555.1 hypothetical protein DFW101_0538 [Solidesulfovibrio carbinoliphilus subsp. oakridgensis]
MTTRRDVLGRGCLWASLAALYILLGMKLFVAIREGLWLDWPLGNFVPDAVVRWVFVRPDAAARTVLAWLLGQDVLYYVAAVALALWGMTLLGGASGAGNSDPSPR